MRGTMNGTQINTWTTQTVRVTLNERYKKEQA